MRRHTAQPLIGEEIINVIKLLSGIVIASILMLPVTSCIVTEEGETSEDVINDIASDIQILAFVGGSEYFAANPDEAPEVLKELLEFDLSNPDNITLDSIRFYLTRKLVDKPRFIVATEAALHIIQRAFGVSLDEVNEDNPQVGAIKTSLVALLTGLRDAALLYDD